MHSVGRIQRFTKLEEVVDIFINTVHKGLNQVNRSLRQNQRLPLNTIYRQFLPSPFLTHEYLKTHPNVILSISTFQVYLCK
jgi:hypothetical protein